MNRNETSFEHAFLPAPCSGGFSMDGYWVWCGSVIKAEEDGLYHMFASRWPKDLPFHPGWGMESEIVRATSKTPEGPYTFAEVVLGYRGPEYWDGRSTHNPVICKYKDEYILFYVGTTHPFGATPRDGSLKHESYQWRAARSNKRTGIATSKSIYGPWTRSNTPLLSVRPDCFDNFSISNATPCINPDGSCLVVYKTRTYLKPPYASDEIYGPMSLGVAWAPHYAGPYQRLTDKPLFDINEGVLEDPFLWRTETGYAMIAKDWKGSYTGDVGSVVYASSADGVHWEMQNHPAFSREVLWDDGKTRTMGNMDRPFILFDGDEMTHLFVATNDGHEAGFATMTRSWNACIPLKITK
ncbi:MAG: glycoside hydrolase family protein [Ruthenibacterium sp.]